MIISREDLISNSCCQTLRPIQNWELTLISLGKSKNKNNPPQISQRGGCPMVARPSAQPPINTSGKCRLFQ